MIVHSHVMRNTRENREALARIIVDDATADGRTRETLTAALLCAWSSDDDQWSEAQERHADLIHESNLAGGV
tara:strand:- start:65 stop:280 length:216 start_codon:yes stop_codon:yes gene_type:complete